MRGEVLITTLLNSIISLFLIILIGVLCGKKNIISDEVNNGLINILLMITLPSMIITSFMNNNDISIKGNTIKAFYLGIATYFTLMIVSYLLVLFIKGDKKTIIHFSNLFPNTGYIGLPVLDVLFGSEGVIYGSIFIMIFNVFLWSYGVSLFDGSFKSKKSIQGLLNLLKNPTIISVVLGVLILIFNIHIPEVLLLSMKSVGNITGPLSMIVVGVILSKSNFKSYFKEWTIYYALALKLILLPMIFYLISYYLLDYTSILVKSIIILVALPAGTMTSIFAERYDKEKEYASLIVLLSTLFSIITIPLLISILE